MFWWLCKIKSVACKIIVSHFVLSWNDVIWGQLLESQRGITKSVRNSRFDFFSKFFQYSMVQYLPNRHSNFNHCCFYPFINWYYACNV